MKILAITLILLGYSLLSFSQDKHLFKLETRDKTTGLPLPDVKVEITILGQPLDFSTRSDGRLAIVLQDHFEGVRPGIDMKLQLEKKGYEVLRHTYIIPDRNISEPLSLSLFSRAIIITGYLKDAATDRHLEGAEVAYLKDHTCRSAKNGFFQLSIPAYLIENFGIEAVLTFKKEGYQDSDTTIVVDTRQRSRAPFEHQMAPNPPPADSTEEEKPHFKTIGILGRYQWTAQNLDTQVSNSWCYDGLDIYCKRYGRLYTWEAAQAACAQLGPGWRLPTEEEWTALARHYGGYETSGYEPGEGDAKAAFKNLTDGAFGAQLGGNKRRNKLKFTEAGKAGYYWTNTEDETEDYRAVYFELSKNGVLKGVKSKSVGMSCRCIRTR
ncbi:MAG: fibrobacter succinogenes major paralogous domain-containing protein [Lewinellaceae bacterium]|nr:fibrobacter succinogenes major paralogous domain-containing protein [Lewinellaceae bacterium]